MRHRVGNVNEKWFVFASLDEADRLVSVTLRKKVHIRFLLNHLLVADDVNHGVVTGGCSEEIVKTLFRGQEIFVIGPLGVTGKIPLSETCGRVTDFFQDLGDSNFLRVKIGGEYRPGFSFWRHAGGSILS